MCTAIDCPDRGRFLKGIVAFMLKNKLHDELSDLNQSNKNQIHAAKETCGRVRELCSSELRLVVILDYFRLDDSVARAYSASRWLKQLYLIFITCFVEHFNVSKSEPVPRCPNEKP